MSSDELTPDQRAALAGAFAGVRAAGRLFEHFAFAVDLAKTLPGAPEKIPEHLQADYFAAYRALRESVLKVDAVIDSLGKGPNDRPHLN